MQKHIIRPFMASALAAALLLGCTPTAAMADTPTHSFKSAISGVKKHGTAHLEAATYSFNNFSQRKGTAGYDVPGGIASIDGAGVTSSTVQMNAHTSTKKSKVPHKAWTTNQLTLLVLHGSTDLKNLTLRGTAQGHLYNGLRLDHTEDSRITNVDVTGVPGSKDYPPGETFGINDFHGLDNTYTNVEVDGKGAGAAGFGGNNSNGTTIANSYFHDNPHSHGVTFWQSRDITIDNVRSMRNEGGFNFERDSGTILIMDPAWSGLKHKFAFAFNSDKASAHVEIHDPVLPTGTSKIYIQISKKYRGVKNKQRTADIHVYMQGRDVTKSIVRFVH